MSIHSNGPSFEDMEDTPVSGTSILNIFPDKNIKLECVSNFRNLGGLPIGGTDGKMVVRPGVINRTAAPTNASLSDEFWLLEVLQVKTLIDLRTTWENKTISPVKKFEDNFVQFSIKKEDRESVATVMVDNNHNNHNLGGSGNNQPTLRVSPPSSHRKLSKSVESTTRLDGTKNGPSLQNSQQNINHQPQNHQEVSPPNQHHQQSPAGNNAWTAATPVRISPPTVIITPEKRNDKEKEMEEQKNGLLWRLYNRNLSSDVITKLRKHSSGTLRKRYCIPLINNRFFLEGVYQTAPSDTKLKCTVSRYLLFNDKVGAYVLMTHLNQLGLAEMYRLTLLYTQEEILTIMRILKKKENYPIMYFCSLGKDRTGMISALLLSCLGVPRDLIVEDYAKTEVNITPFFDQIRRYFVRYGLAKEEFVLAPREIMAGLLNWVDETYGSVNNYLEMLGFSAEEQDEMRANLIVPAEEYHRILQETKDINMPNLQKRHDEYIQLKNTPGQQFASPQSRFWRRVSFSKDLDLVKN